MKKSFISVSIFLTLIAPTLSFAQIKIEDFAEGGLVPCGRAVWPTGSVIQDKNGKSVDISGQVMNPCGFNDFIDLVNNVIHFIIFYLAIPIAAIMFAYAGILFVTAQGGEKKSKGKIVFTHTAVGLIITAAAYIIVRLILQILGYQGGWIGF